MKIVYKYPLEHLITNIQLAKDAKIIKANYQNGIVHLWAETQTIIEETIPRRFRLFGTGEDIPENSIYIDTVFDGGFVWHIYELNIN